MAAETQTAPTRHGKSAAATGLTMFAAVVIIIAGAFDIFGGIAAIARNAYYVISPQYVYRFDVTAWGWTHLIFGAILVLAGSALLAGRTWARVLAVVLAALNAIENFLFLPYSPVWSVLIIALDIAVIWALTRDSHSAA
jgi:hypothetical protein